MLTEFLSYSDGKNLGKYSEGSRFSKTVSVKFRAESGLFLIVVRMKSQEY